MPLYGASKGDQRKKLPRQRESPRWMDSRSITDEVQGTLSLTRLCLLSVVDNINTIWVKDYSDKYLDHYIFRQIMGPFNVLCADLVEDLIKLLCIKKRISRASLDLLLVPQLRTLCLATCPGLVTSVLCTQIAARCSHLSCLDIAGAQHISSKILSQTFLSLPKLRSLSLAGTTTDISVLRVIVQNLTQLAHLDLSRCHLVSPVDLLILGGDALSSHTSCSSTSASCSHVSSAISSVPPLPLKSLLALDIGFEEENGDAVAVAAYLLLSVPSLEKIAIEGIAQACKNIFHRSFDQTDTFSAKHNISPLEDVWKWWKHSMARIESNETNNQVRDINENCSASEEDSNGFELRTCYMQSKNDLTLRLKDVATLSCESLAFLGHLCPDISIISINADYPKTIQNAEVAHLTEALNIFSGQLKILSLQYSDYLENLVKPVCVVGSSLLSLTLEGVKTTFSYSSLLTILQTCSGLREFSILLEPSERLFALPISRPIDLSRLHLPDLRKLTLRYSYEHSQMKPHITKCLLLQSILASLLAQSSLLQNVTLISLPCPLNLLFQQVLRRGNMNQCDSLPLQSLQHLDVQRTDMTVETVNKLIINCKRLVFVNISFCWRIRHSEWTNRVRARNVEVLWM